MNMRQQFVQTVTRLLAKDERVVLLLGDIGVWGFRDAARDWPLRVYNVGILEQATVSLAAGLAKTGLIPIIHTIAPFLTERCLEQIKIDFGYQRLGGCFVTVGASYDYAALGCTHHCPGDVAVMSAIPGVDIALPANAEELDTLLGERYAAGRPLYLRMTEGGDAASSGGHDGKPALIRAGQAATIVAVGPTLDKVLAAADGFDVTVLHYPVIQPFDGDLLGAHATSGKVLLCEPYYRGGLAGEITDALWPRPVLLRSVGVPRRFLSAYGHVGDHDAALGLDVSGIRRELQVLLDA